MEIGLGLYRYRHRGDILLASFLKAGGSVIDAAPNYFNGKAHSLIGNSSVALERGQTLTVWSKVGFARSSEAITEQIRRGLVTPHEIVEGHAVNPALIRAAIRESHAAHPSIMVDALFLHNPELQFHHLKKRGFWALMKRCIEELEHACEDRRIRRWGISVWDGLRGAPSGHSAFLISEWEEIARDVAGPNHHFELVQMPLSLSRGDVIGPFVQGSLSLVVGRSVGYGVT